MADVINLHQCPVGRIEGKWESGKEVAEGQQQGCRTRHVWIGDGDGDMSE